MYICEVDFLLLQVQITVESTTTTTVTHLGVLQKQQLQTTSGEDRGCKELICTKLRVVNIRFWVHVQKKHE